MKLYIIAKISSNLHSIIIFFRFYCYLFGISYHRRLLHYISGAKIWKQNGDDLRHNLFLLWRLHSHGMQGNRCRPHTNCRWGSTIYKLVHICQYSRPPCLYFDRVELFEPSSRYLQYSSGHPYILRTIYDNCSFVIIRFIQRLFLHALEGYCDIFHRIFSYYSWHIFTQFI